MKNYEIVLSPDVEVTPEEFIAAWNESAESREMGEAHVLPATRGLFDLGVTGILISVATGLASNLLYENIKTVIQRIREKKGAQKHPKHTHIEETTKRDGTTILVVDIDE